MKGAERQWPNIWTKKSKGMTGEAERGKGEELGRLANKTHCSYKVRVKILVLYETRRPKASIGTDHVMISCLEGINTNPDLGQHFDEGTNGIAIFQKWC